MAAERGFFSWNVFLSPSICLRCTRLHLGTNKSPKEILMLQRAITWTFARHFSVFHFSEGFVSPLLLSTPLVTSSLDVQGHRRGLHSSRACAQAPSQGGRMNGWKD